MKVVVDFDLCESNAVCMGIAPEVFEVREDNFLYILDENPPESMRPTIEQAVAELPAGRDHARGLTVPAGSPLARPRTALKDLRRRSARRADDAGLEHAADPAGVPAPLRGGLPGQDRDRLRRSPAELRRVRRRGHPGGARPARIRHQPGDRVAYLLPNVPEMLVAHFAVPLAGAVLVAINTRLSTEEVRYILDHSGAKLLVVDAALHPTVAPVAGALKTVEEIITVVDPAYPGDGTGSGVTYDDLLARGRTSRCPGRSTTRPRRSRSTTRRAPPASPRACSTPTAAPTSTRSARSCTPGTRFDSVYLWTLPMFHCNGWCTPWAVTAIGGTHVCLREVRGDVIWRLIREHRVTHLNGAPTVVTTIMRADDAAPLDYLLTITTAGAPPSPTTILGMEKLGFRIVHVYGLTETYGPYSVNQYQRAWDDLEPEDARSAQSRQGVGMVCADWLRVVDAEMNDVPADGATMGEVVMRGNNVMLGYYDDPAATEKAFEGGWFHCGDLGVHAPGRLRGAARPGQGRGGLRRGEHLDDRGRAGHRVAPGGGRGRGDRGARREVGRAAQGVRGARRGTRRPPRTS